MPKPNQYDIVIVGGGVTGGSSACFLAQDPRFDGRIGVIERDPSYQNSPSALATGGFRQQFSTLENIQIGLFGAHFVKHAAQYLSVDGRAPELGFCEHGYLLLATSATQDVLRRNNELQLAHGADTHLLALAELQRRYAWLNTDGLAAGCLGLSNEGWLDSHALLHAYRNKARSLGVKYLHGEVIGIEHNTNAVSAVRLASGERINTGIIINAAGASGLTRIAAMVDLELPVESRKRCTFVFGCREDIGPTPLTVLPEGCVFRPEGARFIVNLAPIPDRDPDTSNTDVDYDLFDQRVWPLLAERVPAFQAIKLHSAYCCHYDVNTLDENLILDRHPEIENFFFAGGFSGHGLQQSPAVGRALSELIVHGDFQTLDLSRFGYQRIVSGEAIFETNCF